MIKITNGVDVFEVTKGAFDGIYSHQGYTKFEEVVNNAVDDEMVSSMNEDDDFVAEVREKPIGQWNKEEIKRFADINNISLAGTKNASEARTIIKDFIDVQGKE